MDAAEQFRALLRKLRTERGFRAASALSRRAGLAAPHVGMIERGVHVPTGHTAEKLANALSLHGTALEEFLRLADLARRDVARKETSAGSLLGAQLWRHLPELLITEVPCERAVSDADPEALIADLVRSVGAVLSCAETLTRPLQASELDELRTAARAGFEGHSKLMFAGFMRIAQLRRQQLFATRDSTRGVLSSLKSWDFQEESCGFSSAVTLTFQHSLSSFDVLVAPVPSVLRVHDALTAAYVWTRLELGHLPLEFRDLLVQAFASERSAVRQVLDTAALRWPVPKRGRSWSIAQYANALYEYNCAHQLFSVAMLSLRLFEIPDLGKLALDCDRDRLDAHLDQLTSKHPRRRSRRPTGRA